jgi:hypothetical protein
LERNPGLRPLLSYHVRSLPRHDDALPPTLFEKDVARIVRDGALPDVPEQVANLLLWLGSHTTPGRLQDVGDLHHRSVIGASDEAGVAFILDHMVATSLLKLHGSLVRDANVHGAVSLTYQGWERYSELRRGAVDSHLAFMAMDFRHPEELDTIFYDHFKPAVASTGFDLQRIDEKPQAGSIDNRLRLEIRRARFAVVDLTYDNSGAYWEAGIAEGLGRPVFFTCRKGETVHFDTRQSYIIFWESDKLPDAANRLKEAIRVTIPEAKQGDDQ